MTKFGTIVFSKNRACQLELLLRSLNIPAGVLYTYDSGFREGYKKLINMYPQIDFVKEFNFKSQLTEFVKKYDFMLLLTDDDVMVEPFDQEDANFSEFRKDSKVATLSLSLSSAVAGKKWEWKKYQGNYRLRMWGYPMSVDSCIFRSEDILTTILANDVTNPNYLETFLNQNIPNRPFMMCTDIPHIINNSVNQVQKDFPAHTIGITPEILEEKFLNGERISLEDIKEKAKRSKIYRMKDVYKYETY